MELYEFTEAIGRLSIDDIREVAGRLGDHFSTAADEVEWWQATIAIDRSLRRCGRWRVAALAASNVARMVLSTATVAGVELPDPGVTSVARSAGEVARGLVAGEPCRAEVDALLRGWRQLFTLPVPA